MAVAQQEAGAAENDEDGCDTDQSREDNLEAEDDVVEVLLVVAGVGKVEQNHGQSHGHGEDIEGRVDPKFGDIEPVLGKCLISLFI